MATLGIDLGTSALRAALATEHGVTALPIGSGDALIAAVSLAGGRTHIGEAALALAASDPDDTARAPSRLLSRTSDLVPTSVAGEELGLPPRSAAPGTLQSAVDSDVRGAAAVSGLLLASVLRVARDATSERIRTVTVSRRSAADERQQNAIIEAAHSAGASLVSLIAEPVACAAGICKPGPVRPVVIVDVGASHVAASVLEAAEGLTPSLLFTESFDLGGDDVDRALMKMLLRSGREPRLDRGTAELLRQYCEGLKRDLAASHITTCQLPPVLESRMGLRGSTTLSREQLEEACSDVLGALGGCCRAAQRVLWDPPERCELYLTGGLTRLPFVRAFIEEIFGTTARTSGATGGIAAGAARLGSALRDSEFAAPPPPRPPSHDRHLVDVSAPPPARLPDVEALPDSLPATRDGSDPAPVARRFVLPGLPDASDPSRGLPDPNDGSAVRGLPDPAETPPLGLPEPAAVQGYRGLPEPVAEKPAIDATPRAAERPATQGQATSAPMPAVRAPSAPAIRDVSSEPAPQSLGWPIDAERSRATRPSQRPTMPMPQATLEEYLRDAEARPTGQAPQPVPAQDGARSASLPQAQPALDEFSPTSGNIANPTSLAEVFALPLGRDIAKGDLEPISIPLLLLVIAMRAQTGLLTLRMEGHELLRVPVVRGWPALSDAEFAVLAESCCTDRGTYEMKESDVQPSARQVRRPVPSLVAEAIRRLVHRFPEAQLREQLGARLSAAPRVDSGHRKALRRFHLTAMEARILSTSFNGNTSGERLLDRAGPARATMLTLMALLTIASMVEWCDAA